MQFRSLLLPSFLISSASLVAAQGYAEPRCAKAGQYCEGPSLKSDIIERCINSTAAEFGNCNDETDAYPGFGYCYQSSNTSGDATCVKDCTCYTSTNGSSFYPVGCMSAGAPYGAACTPPNSNLTTPTMTPSASMPHFTSGANMGSVVPNALFGLLIVAAGTAFAA